MSTAQPTYEDILRLFQETDRQLKETDRQLKETDRQLKETALLLREKSLETDRKFQETDLQRQETDRQLKELGKQIGGLGSKFGSFTEGLALPSMEAILQQRFGMTVVTPRVRARQKGAHLEIDVLAYANGDINKAFLLEVKSHPREEAITQLKTTLRGCLKRIVPGIVRRQGPVKILNFAVIILLNRYSSRLSLAFQTASESVS